MLDLWNQLGPSGQTTIATIFATLFSGVLVWLWQRAWTCGPHAGPQPNWEPWRKQLFALGLSVFPGLVAWAATGKLPEGLLGVFVAWVGSQATHSLAPSAACAAPTGNPDAAGIHAADETP